MDTKQSTIFATALTVTVNVFAWFDAHADAITRNCGALAAIMAVLWWLWKFWSKWRGKVRPVKISRRQLPLL
jgi:hypothetical protein